MTDAIHRRELLGPALEEAAQAIIRDDVPLAAVPELRQAIQGAAMRAVLDARVSLFLKGHTPENDEMLPIGWLPMEARQRLQRVHDELSADGRDLAIVRDQLAETAAFAMAALDWLDRAGV
jgi:hypothetical protein